MFRKIRTRLTVLHAAVFFVILACLGLIIYTELRHQLYVKVDESLRSRLQGVQVFYTSSDSRVPEEREEDDLPGGAAVKRTMIQIQGIDPRVFLVLWDENGTPYPVLAGTHYDEAVDVFKPYRSVRTPETVKVGDHYYRLIGVDYDPASSESLKIMADLFRAKQLSLGLHLPAPGPSGPITSRIVSVQAISIVDSEQNILKKLLELMLLGIACGGAVTVLAGMYLANQALLPIRRSWEKQQQFVADASHELRMPLSIIRANAELVFRHPDRTILDMSEPLSMVLSESARMGKLTDQLLTLARADSDQDEIILKPLHMGEIIHEVAQKFEPLAELKRLRLETKLESGLEMRGDRERLHQLFVILLDNSMKFTPENGMIRIAARRQGQLIEVAVKDTGTGIAAEDLPRIFDRFYRGDKSRSRSTGGTGLGLAIAHWIVARHGGDIAAASEPGQGTTMTLHLPAGPRKSTQ